MNRLLITFLILLTLTACSNNNIKWDENINNANLSQEEHQETALKIAFEQEILDSMELTDLWDLWNNEVSKLENYQDFTNNDFGNLYYLSYSVIQGNKHPFLYTNYKIWPSEEPIYYPREDCPRFVNWNVLINWKLETSKRKFCPGCDEDDMEIIEEMEMRKIVTPYKKNGNFCDTIPLWQTAWDYIIASVYNWTNRIDSVNNFFGDPLLKEIVNDWKNHIFKVVIEWWEWFELSPWTSEVVECELMK